MSALSREDRGCCVRTWAPHLAQKGLPRVAEATGALAQSCLTSCRGSMLSKSGGGEKVKQAFSATFREPGSGGLQGDAVYTDLGFCTTGWVDSCSSIGASIGNCPAPCPQGKCLQSTLRSKPPPAPTVQPGPSAGVLALTQAHLHVLSSATLT